MKKSAYLSFALMGLCALLSSCGGGGSVSVNASAGSVRFFATDDISSFHQVTSTVNKVQFIQAGTSAACDVLSSPTTMDLTDLASSFELLNTTQCPAQSYNRLRIEFGKTVIVTDNNGVTNASCAFTAYKDQNNNSNVLNCSGDTCSLDITGAVNVLANRTNNVALDFDLKNFDVANLAGPNCSVTMKVSPLNASDMNGKMMQGYKAGVTGTISGLDTTAKTFTITKRTMIFTVDYSGVAQQGIDDLLQLAENDSMKVNVRTSTTDFSGTVIASAIYVRVEGTVSGLDTAAHTFDLAYTPAGGSAKTIAVDYTNAVEAVGTPSDGVTADTALTGFNGSAYLAHQVEFGE
jgi:hypothetical protein